MFGWTLHMDRYCGRGETLAQAVVALAIDVATTGTSDDVYTMVWNMLDYDPRKVALQVWRSLRYTIRE